MAQTATGKFPVGFRTLNSDWQKDPLNAARYALANGFDCIDVRAIEPDVIKAILDLGLKLGTVDARDWRTMLSEDAGKRKAAVESNAHYMTQLAEMGVKTFFTVMVPEDPAVSRKVNFGHMVDSYAALGEQVASLGVKIAVEGWPGGAPHYANLACTPETYRAMIEAVPGEFVGVNFDPSHLVRMGICPERFVKEFAPHVFHAHGKDTRVLRDDLYNYGTLQDATFHPPPGWGGAHWRYTIPGEGDSNWHALLSVLKDVGYRGCVSIELEDANYNGTEPGEKRGLEKSRDFLAAC